MLQRDPNIRCNEPSSIGNVAASGFSVPGALSCEWARVCREKVLNSHTQAMVVTLELDLF